MARVNIYVPAELHRRALDELPVTESLSGIFQEALRARLARTTCTHAGGACCARCHQEVPLPAA